LDAIANIAEGGCVLYYILLQVLAGNNCMLVCWAMVAGWVLM